MYLFSNKIFSIFVPCWIWLAAYLYSSQTFWFIWTCCFATSSTIQIVCHVMRHINDEQKKGEYEFYWNSFQSVSFEFQKEEWNAWTNEMYFRREFFYFRKSILISTSFLHNINFPRQLFLRVFVCFFFSNSITTMESNQVKCISLASIADKLAFICVEWELMVARKLVSLFVPLRFDGRSKVLISFRKIK